MTRPRLNNTNIIGDSLPSVFIDNVILESGGSPILIDDPHIDHPSENRDSISNPSGGSKVEVRLLLKDVIGTSGLGSWYSNTEINKYIKILIMASLSEEITDFLSRTPPEDLNYGNQNFAQGIRIGLIREGFDRNAIPNNLFLQEKTINDSELNSDNLSDFERFRDSDGNEIYNIHYAARFEFLEKNPQHLTIFALTCLDVAQLASDHGLDLDMQDANSIGAAAAGMSRITSQFVIDAGTVLSEAVIFYDPEGRVWTGGVHQHPENGQWMGGSRHSSIPHPYLERRVVPNTAVQDFRNVEDLPKRLVDLTQIDSRFAGLDSLFKKFVRYNLDIADKAAYFSKIFMSREALNSSTTSAEGGCSFSFAIDTHRVYRDHTKYPRLLKSYPGLINKFKIRQFKVLRRRVITNPGEDNKKGLRVFDKNEAPYVVIVNSERSPGRFLGAQRMTENILDDERPINSVREMNIYSPNASGVRHFSVSDRDIAAAEFGQYQYGVEIEVEDQLNSYIEEQLENLIIARKNFDRYYKKAIQPSGRGATPNQLQKDPHVNMSRQIVYKNSKGNFDIYSNRFTQKFITEMETEYPNDNSAPWVDSVATYLRVMSIFTESGVSQSQGQLDNEETFVDSILTPAKMFALCSPTNGTPAGMGAILGLMDDLVRRIEKLLGIVTGQGTDDSVSPGAQSGLSDGGGGRGARRTNTFKLTHYFDNEIFDADVRKFSGFDYLNSNSTAGRHGLRYVTGTEFEDRVSRENLKYFQVDDPNLDVSLGFDMAVYTQNDTLGRNSVTFFSPTTVYYGLQEEPLDLLETSPLFADTHKLIRIASHIAKFKFTEAAPGSVPVARGQWHQSLVNMLGGETTARGIQTQHIVKDNLDEIFADKGVTVSVRAGQDTVENPLDSDEVFGNQRNEALERLEERGRTVKAHTTRDFDTPYTNQLFARLMFDFVYSENMRSSLSSSDLEHLSIQNFNMRNSNNGIEKAKERRRGKGRRGLRSRDIAVQLPNQIKSLFLSSVTANQFVKSNYFSMGIGDPYKDPRYTASFLLNYMSLVRIEVFEGFRIGDENEQLMKADNWSRLTVEKYNNAKEAEQELICRLVPYSSKVYGIFSAKGLALPIYDEYFILSPGRGTPRTTINIVVADQNKKANIVRDISQMTRRSRLFNREHISTDVNIVPSGRRLSEQIQTQAGRSRGIRAQGVRTQAQRDGAMESRTTSRTTSQTSRTVSRTTRANTRMTRASSARNQSAQRARQNRSFGGRGGSRGGY